MKYFLATIIALSMLSCQKEMDSGSRSSGYFHKITSVLKDSLSAADYASLEFNRVVASSIDSLEIRLLRIPISGRNLRNDFVLVKTNADASSIEGKIIHLSDNENTGVADAGSFTGSILISSLNRKDARYSAIHGGYIEAFHQKQAGMRTLSMENPYQTLPEVIVVSTISTGGVSYSTWMSLLSLYGDYGGGGGDSYYGNLDVYTGGGGGGSGSTTTTTTNDLASGDGWIVQMEPLMVVDEETGDDKEAINIQEYIKCFSSVPDAGASCSIEILTDIPVDGDPNKLFNWDLATPGHTFIQLKKKNGSQSVMQNIGFYPNKDWKTILTSAPIEGKFVDNGQHEFNASLLMTLSPENFQRTLNEVLYLAGFVKYDIDEYNCTDFALDVFNKTRSAKLIIPKYDVPNGDAPFGTSTPQGLYSKLKAMKDRNDTEAVNITIQGAKGWVAESKGPCN